MHRDGSKQAEFLRHTALAPGAVHWRLWGRGLQFPFHCLAWVSCLFCFARFDLYNLFSAQASFRSYLRWHLSCICILKTHHPGLFFPCCLGLMSGENTLCLVSGAHGSHPGNWFVSHPGRGLHSCFVFGLQSWKSLLHLYIPCMLCMGYEEPCSYYSRVHLRLFCDQVRKDGHRQPMLPGNHRHCIRLPAVAFQTAWVVSCRAFPFFLFLITVFPLFL